MTAAISTKNATEIATAVRAGRLSALAVIEATIATIAARDPALNCFTAVLPDRARRTAQAVDAAVAQGRDPGPLAGVPFAAKNLFDIAGLTTLAGSRILADAPPAAADAFVIRQLEAAGAILVGATNMDEFAYGFSTENAHHGVTRNPHDTTRIAGGSSGGSAAAVAAGLVPLSIGSDTNGSVRVPAALCGVYGLKPTFGRLSRTGCYPFVDSLDHVGVFARSAADLALAYAAMQGEDAADPVQAEQRGLPAAGSLTRDNGTRDNAALRIGLLGGWFARHADAPVKAAIAQFAAATGTPATLDLAGSEAARAAAFCLTAAEGGALHLGHLRSRQADFDAAVRDRMLAGTLLPAAVIRKAQQIRAHYRAEAQRMFADHDILIAPTTICTAPRIGQASVEIDGTAIPVRGSLGLYTQPISFIGLPVVAAPLWRSGERPIGIQIIAAPWREDVALRYAAALERDGLVGADMPSGTMSEAA